MVMTKKKNRGRGVSRAVNNGVGRGAGRKANRGNGGNVNSAGEDDRGNLDGDRV